MCTCVLHICMQVWHSRQRELCMKAGEREQWAVEGGYMPGDQTRTGQVIRASLVSSSAEPGEP